MRAKATPAMLPVPTVEARAVHRQEKGLAWPAAPAGFERQCGGPAQVAGQSPGAGVSHTPLHQQQRQHHAPNPFTPLQQHSLRPPLGLLYVPGGQNPGAAETAAPGCWRGENDSVFGGLLFRLFLPLDVLEGVHILDQGPTSIHMMMALGTTIRALRMSEMFQAISKADTQPTKAMTENSSR